jgi:hypothetical protein
VYSLLPWASRNAAYWSALNENVVKPWLAELPASENDGARKPFEIVPRRATVLMGVNLTPIFGEKLPPKSE